MKKYATTLRQLLARRNTGTAVVSSGFVFSDVYLEHLDVPSIWRRRGECISPENCQRLADYRKRIVSHLGGSV